MTDDKKALGKVNLRRDNVAKPTEDPAAEMEALKLLSEKHGVPGIDLNQICIRLEDLELLPREIAERRLILPVLVRDDRVFVAMTNPGDERVIDELEFVTGKRVFPYVALPAALERVIEAAYDAKRRGETFHIGPSCPPEIQRRMGAISDDAPHAAPPEMRGTGYSAATGSAQGSGLGDTTFDAPTSRIAPERLEEAAEHDDLSYSDIGVVGRDLSVVTELPDQPAPSAAAGKTVLVVDDEPDIRKILSRVLTQKGFRVIEAERGLEALKLVKAHLPDLLLLDAMLPEVNGFEIAKRVKGSQKYGHIPIIMVSAVYKGWRFAEDAKASYGVDAYIEKPFRISDVVTAVEKILLSSAAARPAPEQSADRTLPDPVSPDKDEPPPTPRVPQRLMPRDPESLSADAERCLNEGVAAYQKGNLDAAIEHLKRGLAIDGLAYRLHFHLGLLYGKKGMVYEAIQELERAIEANDTHFAAVKNLAVLYQKAGFKNKAVETWERAIRVAPDETTRASIKQHLLTLL